MTNVCHVDLEYNGREELGCVEAAQQEADYYYFLNFTTVPVPLLTELPHVLCKYYNNVTFRIKQSNLLILTLVNGDIKQVTYVNGISYIDPHFPPLTQDDSRFQSCNTSTFYDDGNIRFCTHMIEFPTNKVVDLYYCDDVKGTKSNYKLIAIVFILILLQLINLIRGLFFV